MENEAEGKWLVCISCWQKTDNKNPPVVGKLMVNGSVEIKRYSRGYSVINGDDFEVSCRCGNVVFKKVDKEENGVRRFVWDGSFYEQKIDDGGTVAV